MACLTGTGRPLCRHCDRGRPAGYEKRGLCWSCYMTPGLRELYPSTSKYAYRGVGNFCGNAPLPPEPTRHPPASPEKMAVLAERAARGWALFHPADASWEAWGDDDR